MTRVPSLQQVAQPLKNPQETLLWPTMGLLLSCSRLAKCSRIRDVFSRAGGMSGLHQTGHRKSSESSGLFPRAEACSWQLASYQEPSGGRQLGLLLPGKRSDLFTSLSGLGTCYTPTTQSPRPPASPGTAFQETQKDARVETSYPQDLACQPWIPTQRRLISCPAFYKRPCFQSFLLTSVQH